MSHTRSARNADGQFAVTVWDYEGNLFAFGEFRSVEAADAFAHEEERRMIFATQMAGDVYSDECAELTDEDLFEGIGRMKKYADVRVTLIVSFEDDGENDLKDQAHDAAIFAGLPNGAFDVEVIGEVRDTE
jgi:hypothetical protein